MLLAIVYIPLKSVSRPSIILIVLVLLVVLATSYHPLLQYFLHLVYFIFPFVCWYGMVLIAGPSVSLEVAL